MNRAFYIGAGISVLAIVLSILTAAVTIITGHDGFSVIAMLIVGAVGTTVGGVIATASLKRS